MKILHFPILGPQLATSILARQIACALFFLGAGLVLMRPCADGSPIIFEETGSLATGRVYHAQTLLPNGKVLVTGGFNDIDVFASAELYDPATETWMATGSLNVPRFRHTATLLPDGRVLVAGGLDLSGAIASAELYDPATGTWTETGRLVIGRAAHTATLLPDGSVLLAAGCAIGR